jgi:hypothetical protein
MVLFQNLPEKERAERQSRKEKGRALQSKLFLKFFWFQLSPHVYSRPDSANPQARDHAAR